MPRFPNVLHIRRGLTLVELLAVIAVPAPLITFSSWHTVGVQFCFADGSVRTVRFGDTAWDERSPFTNDWLLLQQLAGYKAGQSADASSLLE